MGYEIAQVKDYYDNCHYKGEYYYGDCKQYEKTDEFVIKINDFPDKRRRKYVHSINFR